MTDHSLKSNDKLHASYVHVVLMMTTLMDEPVINSMQ